MVAFPLHRQMDKRWNNWETASAGVEYLEIQYWNIWIENTFACIRIIVLGIYRTSFQHNLHCFINACVHVVND